MTSFQHYSVHFLSCLIEDGHSGSWIWEGGDPDAPYEVVILTQPQHCEEGVWFNVHPKIAVVDEQVCTPINFSDIDYLEYKAKQCHIYSMVQDDCTQSNAYQ